MKVLVINGTHRPKGITIDLITSFLEGVRAGGGEGETVMLRDKTIGYCTNCLTCYRFTGEGVAPCSLKDDMEEIIDRIVGADGILFASPVHNGFVSGLMTVFWERLSWRVGRPGGPVCGCMSIRSRINNKIRALGSIANAGGMPERLRKTCDDGTRWLKSNAPLMLHGQWIGDQYAGADLERRPQNDEDWQRIFFLRRLSPRQHKKAYDLGMEMVQRIRSGRLTPFVMEKFLPSALRWVMERIATISPPYRIVKD